MLIILQRSRHLKSDPSGGTGGNCCFQPHRYSRTKFLLEEFTTAFNDADIIILTDIFAPPPEQLIPVSSEIMADKMRKLGKTVYLVNDQSDVAEF